MLGKVDIKGGHELTGGQDLMTGCVEARMSDRCATLLEADGQGTGQETQGTVHVRRTSFNSVTVMSNHYKVGTKLTDQSSSMYKAR